MPINTSDPKGCRIGLILALVSSAIFIATVVVALKKLGVL